MPTKETLKATEAVNEFIEMIPAPGSDAAQAADTFNPESKTMTPQSCLADTDGPAIDDLFDDTRNGSYHSLWDVTVETNHIYLEDGEWGDRDPNDWHAQDPVTVRGGTSEAAVEAVKTRFLGAIDVSDDPDLPYHGKVVGVRLYTVTSRSEGVSWDLEVSAT